MILNLGLLFLSSFLGASVGALVKLLVPHLSPLMIAGIRFLGGLLCIAPFVFKKDLFKKIVSDKVIQICGLFFAMNIILYAIGIQYTSLIVGQLLYVLSPLIVAVIGYIFLREKLTKNQILGLGLSLIGVILLIFGSIENSDISTFGKPVGNILIAFAVISWSTYTVLSRKISQNFKPNEITFSNFLIASMVSVVSLGPLAANGKLQYSTQPTVILIAGTLAVVALVFIIVYQLLIKKTSAFISSLNLYPQFVWSALLGIIIFAERLTFALIFGILLIILGVFIATTYTKLKKLKLWTYQ